MVSSSASPIVGEQKRMMNSLFVCLPPHYAIIKVVKCLRKRLIDVGIIVCVKANEKKDSQQRIIALPWLIVEMRYQTF
ncbi:MAG TPA: hypothetical protein DCZ97_14255 [Syntrophus sp. (in: bacteria)]|nr:MAG: hypothetical protein A2X92_05605 [Syntrophus sp. GWC2_56_31]HBB18094.1 hypothetical protein [Syntrophus sp. (in: bacteria)]